MDFEISPSKRKGSNSDVKKELEDEFEREMTKTKGSGPNRYPPPKEGEFQFDLLPRHVEMQASKKIYRCDICNGVYRHAFSLKRHYIRNHINYLYICEADRLNCCIKTEEVENFRQKMTEKNKKDSDKNNNSDNVEKESDKKDDQVVEDKVDDKDNEKESIETLDKDQTEPSKIGSDEEFQANCDSENMPNIQNKDEDTVTKDENKEKTGEVSTGVDDNASLEIQDDSNMDNDREIKIERSENEDENVKKAEDNDADIAEDEDKTGEESQKLTSPSPCSDVKEEIKTNMLQEEGKYSSSGFTPDLYSKVRGCIHVWDCSG